MCGIIVLLSDDQTHLPKSLDALKARGPDAQVQEILAGKIGIGFARLHVQGSSTAMEQPYRLRDGRRVMCNGEIFNAEILIRQLGLRVPAGSSDCAVIPALLERGMSLPAVARQLDGDFAIVVVSADGTVQAARDPYGVRPLFYGKGSAWTALASKIAAFPPGATKTAQIEPGTVQEFSATAVGQPTTWHEIPWLKIPYWRSSVEALTHAGSALRQALEEAVAKRLSTVRTISVHLTGDLGSSLIAAIAARRMARTGRRLITYGSAEAVAAHIGSEHHTGAPQTVVVLEGLGADEVLGSDSDATDDITFEQDTGRRLRTLHEGALLQSEATAAEAGMETRYPFLDRQFVAVARSLPTDVLRPTSQLMAKAILRTAFAGVLPEAMLWSL
jgi:asparagine synthase (glutamine-hydrolysing)